MVMQVQPLRATIKAAKVAMGIDTRVIYLSPQGRRLDQDGIQLLLNYQRILMVTGRYEGVDERLIEQDIDEEWSIGDYVLSGGELAAMVIIDVLTRFLPGVLEEIDGQRVPTVLLSGNHAEIARWRHKQALGRTFCRYPALLEKWHLTPEALILLNEFIEEQQT